MVEKFLDWLKKLPAKIMEWWNKFSSKQKTAIIAVSIGIVVAFAILITVITRTQYTNLVTCENTNQASTVRDLLVSGDIKYRVSDSGLVFDVNTKQLADAKLLLGANNIMADSYSIENVVNGGFSTTEADKQKLYVAYLESDLANVLSQYSFVESATVKLNMPEDNGTLIAQEQQAFASILLKLSGTCSEENASSIARYVKTSIGNDTTENVVIMDTDGNLLFSGGDELSVAGTANSQSTAKQQVEAIVKNEVKTVLLGTNEFDLIEVASNLVLDFSTTDYAEHTYSAPDGAAQGLLSHESGSESQTEGGSAAVPGTDSNGEDTYVFQDGDGGSSTMSEFEKDYLPNEVMTQKTIPPGLVVYDDSSIAVSAITYKVLKEEDAKSQGLLDGTSWDEYKLNNSTRTKKEVDEDFYAMVSNATGIPLEKISIIAYEEPFFVDKEALKVDFTDILQIVLIALIVLLLAYVVIRSLKSSKNTAEEPEELSVEKLLQSMPSEPIEDIELETKSETRKMIEKFVDENPEAVANLLRNWLNEDWN